MRLAIGFCAAFLNASLFVAAAGVSCVATSVPAGPTGVSWANSRPDSNSRNPSKLKARAVLFARCIDASSSIFRAIETLCCRVLHEAWRRNVARFKMIY
jgi:hypothetical protein